MASWIFLVLLVAACTPPQADIPPPQPTEASVPAKVIADPSLSASCPKRSSTTIKATGKAVRATTLKLTAPFLQRNVALSAETLRALPEALSTSDFLDIEYAYTEGAFAAGGGEAQVSFENTTDRFVSVYDIRPVNIVVECIPLAALVAYTNEGGDAPWMVFDMDAAAPIAWATDAAGNITQPYFKQVPGITLPPKGKEEFSLTFMTEAGAYTFDVLVAYETGGSKEQILLRNGEVPFRITTDMCPSEEGKLALAPDEVEYLRSLRYQNVRSRLYRSIVTVPPDEYAARCKTW